MAVDFEIVLVVLTLVTGVAWGWHKWQQRRRRPLEGGEGGEAPAAPVNWWLDLGVSLFPVVLAVLVIRSFMYEPFRIPSGSMIPTLYSGDFILVDKFAYGLRLPAVHTKVVDLGGPKRGDVVVFRYPLNPAQDYIKRVVGLPGDQIAYRNRVLYVNGERVEQVALGRYTGPQQEGEATLKHERLGGVEHPILLHTGAEVRDFEYRVPQGSYFVMGDNRDRSSDSRFWGPVPERNLVGKAVLIWMSWNQESMRINWERLGDRIR